ncbi:MAG: hypothetical protein ABI462_14785 [Ignavibacteria bacterium]
MIILRYSLICFVLLFNLNCNSQSSFSKYFEKEKINCDFANSPQSSYYKIEFIKQGKPLFQCSYFFDFKDYKEEEKIRMIQELLKYEGDTSLCAVKVNCYNPKRSQTVPKSIEYYSIQVEALFIINHIIFADPYSYSAYPILRDKDGRNIETINGELIKKAFMLYKNWFEKMRITGLTKAIRKKILPLNDVSPVFWY